MRAQRQGFTLVETIISFGLLLLATAMMVALFIPSMSLFRRQTGKSDSYRGCLMLMEKFRIGLMNAQMETVTVHNSGDAVSWQLFEEDPPFSGTSGDALMSKNFAILYYKEEEKKVYYKVFEFGGAAGSDQPSVLSQSDIESAIASTSTRTQVIGRNIVEFDISDKDGDLGILEPPLSLNIVSEIDTRGQETNDVETFGLETSVTPRSMRW